MDEATTPAPDLFDERSSVEATSRSGAISPLTSTDARRVPHTRAALRWRAAGLALAAGVAIALVSHFPFWATAALATFAAAVGLWPIPRLATRACWILAASFFFAQCTTIFVNQPFDWPMRFGFCAALLTTATIVRVSGDE